jgi:hypothetical protein
MRRITTCRRQHNYGQDVLVGIIDVNGFDFAHPDFLDADGHTRFEAIWDQGGSTRPPPPSRKRSDKRGFQYGSLIRKHHMDAAIDAAPARKMAPARLEPQSQMVPGSHGTHPERRAGTITTFGVPEASRSTDENAGAGLNFVLDISAVRDVLADAGQWDPANLRVAFVPLVPTTTNQAALDEIAEGAEPVTPDLHAARIVVMVA